MKDSKKYFWFIGAFCLVSALVLAKNKAKGVYDLKEICVEDQSKKECGQFTVMRFGKDQKLGRNEDEKGYLIGFRAFSYFRIPVYWVIAVFETQSDMIIDLENFNFGRLNSSAESKYLGKFKVSLDKVGEDYIWRIHFEDRNEKVTILSEHYY